MKTHPGTFVTGIVFVVVGLAYLLESLDVWEVSPGRIWPIFLVALGAAILAGGTRSDRSDGD
jgi:hypothetical protein